MVWDKFAGCCLGPRLSNGTICMVGIDTNHFLSSQTQAEAHFSFFLMKIHQNPHFWFKNPISSNVKNEFVERKKIFLVDTMGHCMLSGSCLGPRLSNKANGVVIRHTNPFLWPQTQGESDFFVFVPSQSGFQAKSKWNERFWVFFKNNVSTSIAILRRLTHRNGTR